ncbi:hypothetical protein CKO28_00685 [Rhodovibrio sodomensis]|uniref:Uncharacterized protein n=1 Tax=Rhodovibrio sodomensis TaxID=1088 RepID=A0ABS1D8V6_9PROT|nr:hypothetical protein [Rhodovibrio sodomensis]MBK1666557.1 hypothetical protein [Rhodovibrio sodomensis]
MQIEMSLSRAKTMARTLAKTTNMPYGQALHTVANQLGYDSFEALAAKLSTSHAQPAAEPAPGATLTPADLDRALAEIAAEEGDEVFITPGMNGHGALHEKLFGQEDQPGSAGAAQSARHKLIKLIHAAAETTDPEGRVSRIKELRKAIGALMPAPETRKFTLVELDDMETNEVMDLLEQEESGLIAVEITDTDRQTLEDAWLEIEMLGDPSDIYDTLSQGFVGMTERGDLCLVCDLKLNERFRAFVAANT